MEFRPAAIIAEAVETKKQIDEAISAIAVEAIQNGIAAGSIRDSHGNFMMPPLLQAKAMCLHTIALMQRKER